jgi:hypothetical protein
MARGRRRLAGASVSVASASLSVSGSRVRAGIATRRAGPGWRIAPLVGDDLGPSVVAGIEALMA